MTRHAAPRLPASLALDPELLRAWTRARRHTDWCLADRAARTWGLPTFHRLAREAYGRGVPGRHVDAEEMGAMVLPWAYHRLALPDGSTLASSLLSSGDGGPAVREFLGAAQESSPGCHEVEAVDGRGLVHLRPALGGPSWRAFDPRRDWRVQPGRIVLAWPVCWGGATGIMALHPRTLSRGQVNTLEVNLSTLTQVRRGSRHHDAGCSTIDAFRRTLDIVSR